MFKKILKLRKVATIVACLAVSSLFVNAQTQYIIQGSGSSFNVQYFSGSSWKSLSNGVDIQTAIDAILQHCGGNAMLSFAGSPLNIGSSTVTFTTSWNTVYMQGSLTSSAAGSTITINGSTTTVMCMAEIANTNSSGAGTAIVNNSSNFLINSAAKISSTGTAIDNKGTITISDAGANISSTGTGSTAIVTTGTSSKPAKVSITAGTVTSNSNNQTVWVSDYGQLEIKGGTIENTGSNQVAIKTTSTYPIVFDVSSIYTLSGVITGAGSGGVTKNGTANLIFTGNNNYTGVTTVNMGALVIGNNTATGAIAGNINLVSGTLGFSRSNAYTYSGVISGTGNVEKNYAGTVTLTGNNTYSGLTTVNAGDLQIGNNGTTGAVAGSIDLKAGTNLFFSRSNDYTYSKVISGLGNVEKYGSGTLTLDNPAHTATGTLTLSEGTLAFTGDWAGNFIQSSATTFKPIGNVAIGGTLELRSGFIQMDLSGSSPSRITATGACTATGTNKITISPAAAPTGQILIKAASGVNATNFSLTNTGQSSQLTSNGTQLILSAGSAAIDEVLAAKINIYPNPVKDYLRFTNYDLRINMIEILDLSGKTIVNLKSSIVNQIDVSNLASGVYFLKLETDEGIVTKKFVKE